MTNDSDYEFSAKAVRSIDPAMLKDKGQPSFEEKWPSMRPTILKLLRQCPV